MNNTPAGSTRQFRREDFRLRPAGGGGFGAVEAALARKLITLSERPERIAVVVALADDRDYAYFTQAIVYHWCGAWVEAVSNEFIIGDHNKIDADQERLLGAFGFAPPDEDMPNHWLILQEPVDWWKVAALLVQPLETVYGADAHAEIVVDAFDVGVRFIEWDEDDDTPEGDAPPDDDGDDI